MTEQACVPLDVRQELMKCANDKAISYYWLCGIYRRGLAAGLVAALVPTDEVCINCQKEFGAIDVRGYYGLPDRQVGPFCERCYGIIQRHAVTR